MYHIGIFKECLHVYSLVKLYDVHCYHAGLILHSSSKREDPQRAGMGIGKIRILNGRLRVYGLISWYDMLRHYFDLYGIAPRQDCIHNEHVCIYTPLITWGDSTANVEMSSENRTPTCHCTHPLPIKVTISSEIFVYQHVCVHIPLTLYKLAFI